jgi:hypothetical protein
MGFRICTREHDAERRSRALVQDDSGDLSGAVVFEFQTAEGVTSRSRDEFRPSFASRASLELKAGAGECRALAATHGPRAVKKSTWLCIKAGWPGANHIFPKNGSKLVYAGDQHCIALRTLDFSRCRRPEPGPRAMTAERSASPGESVTRSCGRCPRAAGRGGHGRDEHVVADAPPSPVGSEWLA